MSECHGRTDERTDVITTDCGYKIMTTQKHNFSEMREYFAPNFVYIYYIRFILYRIYLTYAEMTCKLQVGL